MPALEGVSHHSDPTLGARILEMFARGGVDGRVAYRQVAGLESVSVKGRRHLRWSRVAWVVGIFSSRGVDSVRGMEISNRGVEGSLACCGP